MTPFFSIIIPTLNSAATIDAALESVARQDCRDFEVIVSDGVSTDGTLEAASRFTDRLEALTILSRQDAGVYDAINRAIAVARGSWIYVLGSDDRLHAPGVLSRFRAELASSREPLVYGDVIVRGRTTFGADGQRYDGEFTLERLVSKNVCQQAVFYRRELFDRMGGFDQRYRVVADWHFALRAFAEHPTRWVDAVVCDFACGGLSSREADHAFALDYPDLLLRILLASPMRREFASLRWFLYRHAKSCWSQGRMLQAARFYAGFAWLGVREKMLPALPIAPPQLAWQPCAPCPNRRTEPAAVKAGHRLLVFGGYQDIDHVLSVVDVFDFNRGAWTDQIEMPPGVPQTHAGIACGEDRFVYLAGGQVGPRCSPAVADCFVLDAATWEWSRLPPLPEPRYSPTAQVWNGRLHVISGAKPDRWTSACDHWSIAVAGGQALESEWREELPSPTGGPHRASAILGGALYLLGGQDGDVKPIAANPEGACDWNTPLETVYADSFMMKPGADRWEPVSPIPTACSHTESVVTIDHYAVLTGGNEARNRLCELIQVYDSQSDRWRVAGRLPHCMKTTAAYHDGWIYSIAGQRSVNRDDRKPIEVLNSVWRARFDPRVP